MSKPAAFFVLLVSLTLAFQLAHSLRTTKWIEDAAQVPPSTSPPIAFASPKID
jgi:hypothetical protein